MAVYPCDISPRQFRSSSEWQRFDSISRSEFGWMRQPLWLAETQCAWDSLLRSANLHPRSSMNDGTWLSSVHIPHLDVQLSPI